MVTAMILTTELAGTGAMTGQARTLTFFGRPREKCSGGAVGTIQASAACFAISLKAGPT